MHPNRESHALSETGGAFCLGANPTEQNNGSDAEPFLGDWMGKLKALPPRVQLQAPRLGFVQGDAKAADRARNTANSWRAWYKTKRWEETRQRVLVRDLFTCAMCSRMSATGMVVDHIRAHRGNEALFWDEGNLQVLCASPCHNKHKQQIERAELGR
jgi:5-methylcytosine-specific restriction protein A